MPSSHRSSHRALSLILGLLGICMFSASSAAAAETGRYIVVFKDSVGAPGELARVQTESRDAKLGYVYRHAVKGYSAELTKDEVEGLRRNANVKYVTRDHVLRLFKQSTPTGIDRTFATSNERLDIDEEDDERVDVDVAVIDTGVDAHEDLNVFKRTDCAIQEKGSFKCVDNVGNDYEGHGTHVGGTIGAIDNGKGAVGVAPGARLWSVRVYLFTPIQLFESSAMAGVDWVAAHSDEIEVANMSFGCTEGIHPGCSSLPALEEAISDAVDKGVVFVAAAGNEGVDAARTHPAASPDVITVSALEDLDGLAGKEKDPLASFSNFGSAVEVAAPGVEIFSTLPGNKYGYESGTSMASPHVAGAAAILASGSNPESRGDVEEIRDQIVGKGNFDWEDTSEDGTQEPLLDISDELLFDANGPEPGTWTSTKDFFATEAGLEDISCSSPSSCISVGSHTDSFGVVKNQILKHDSWPWTSETFQTPGGAKSIDFAAVECPEEKNCHTVGSYIDSAGVERVLALRHYKYISSEWKVQTISNPQGASASRLSDMSCGLELCMAVGSSTVGGAEFPVAYEWNGSGWPTPVGWGELEVPPMPEESVSAELESVSCQYGGGEYVNKEEESVYVEPGCIAVGFYLDGSEERRPLILKYDASGWEAIDEPGVAESQEGELNSVGCDPLGSCVAVGSYLDGSSERRSLGLALEEGEWSVSYIPEPSGSEGSELISVSCAGQNQEEEEEMGGRKCAAVGSYEHTGETLGRAVRWSGSAWAQAYIPGLSMSVTDARFDAVSCKEGSCRAVGSATHDNHGSVFASGEGSLTGWEWTMEQIAPQGSSLTGLSCGSSTDCMAVGTADGLPLPGQDPKPLGWNFDNSDWTPMSMPAASEPSPHGVSCSAANACTAFGDSGGNSAFLARRWNGSWWTSQSPPIPVAGHKVYGRDISCPTSSLCMTVGWHHSTGSNAYKPVIHRWNGSWSINWNFAIGHAAELSGISCASATSCVAVGHSRSTSTSAEKAISMAWDGTSWVSKVVPQPAGLFSSQLTNVSCASASACAAVGSYWTTSGQLRGFVVLWDGSSWTADPLPRLSGTESVTQVHDISCWEDSGCRLIATTNKGAAVAMKWRGWGWALETLPAPSIHWRVRDLDCSAIDHCVAAGDSGTYSGSYPVAMAVGDKEG